MPNTDWTDDWERHIGAWVREFLDRPASQRADEPMPLPAPDHDAGDPDHRLSHELAQNELLHLSEQWDDFEERLPVMLKRLASCAANVAIFRMQIDLLTAGGLAYPVLMSLAEAMFFFGLWVSRRLSDGRLVLPPSAGERGG
jgi:hypothetical protein